MGPDITARVCRLKLDAILREREVETYSFLGKVAAWLYVAELQKIGHPRV